MIYALSAAFVAAIILTFDLGYGYGYEKGENEGIRRTAALIPDSAFEDTGTEE